MSQPDERASHGRVELRLPAHDLANREVVGQATGPHKDADLMRAVFATPEFPISDIEIFHVDRGSELDNAVDESTNKILKA